MSASSGVIDALTSSRQPAAKAATRHRSSGRPRVATTYAAARAATPSVASGWRLHAYGSGREIGARLVVSAALVKWYHESLPSSSHRFESDRPLLPTLRYVSSPLAWRAPVVEGYQTG